MRKRCCLLTGGGAGRADRCEIIRDFKTGDSLCYAFVEFTDRKSCEEAYFKMNNVLIDDRRIKVRQKPDK